METSSIRKVLIAIVVLIVIVIIIYLMFVAVRSGLNMLSTRTLDSGMGINDIVNDVSTQIKQAPSELRKISASISKGFNR